MRRQLIIGSDHAGFECKQDVKALLARMEIDVTDVGTDNGDAVDYPDYGLRVAERVASGDFTSGILICGSGVGMSIVANKFPHVRAALCLDEYTAEMSRRHNDANILILAGRRTDAATAEKIVTKWLSTEFEGGRHQRRLDKIRELEEKLGRETQICQNSQK
ncbi:MAG: ribose 5-phosphate isomerase B [Syntrophales bacterium]|jgi:ribose 5-phosphate isomerase B|nr:ribose 5-phosphate isomerase B [Syntrophales bacterium]